MVFFQVLGFLTCVVEQFFMTQLTSVYAKFKKKTLPFCYCPQPWIVQLHITDDSRMKDVLQLTTEIVVASSTKKKLKNIQKVIF